MGSRPDRIGKYHVLGRIASGGMAEVYKVKTVGIAGFEKVQALKRILPAWTQEQRFIRSFVDEARIAVELSHRNIVQVFDFGEADGELFLAMELIEGVDLRTACTEAARRQLPLPIAVACYLIAEIAGGLDHAHRKSDPHGRSLGIVHCDVSPQNVMLSFDGYVKILDFGVARAHFTTVAPSNRLRGKPRYMAPEQARGEAPTAATDVFALGIIAWELLTGLALFDGDDVPSILSAVRRAEVPPVGSLNPDAPARLAEAIGRALSVEPTLRGSAGELGAAANEAVARLGAASGPRPLSTWLTEVIPRDHDAIPEPLSAAATAPLRRPTIPPPAPRRPPSAEPPSAEPPSAEPDDLSEISLISVTEITEPTRPLVTGSRVGDDHRAAEVTALPGAATFVADPDIAAVAPRGPDELSGLGGHETLLDRRRVVALALLADSASSVLPSLLRTLADLAYKRGAALHEERADGFVAVFGLEVAGEDDVAHAMGFALDAIETAREAGPTAGGVAPVELRIGVRAGVVAQRRDDDGFHLVGDGIDEARALARDASPGRALLSGGTGRLASAHYTFREVPPRRHVGRRLRVFELLGARSYDERGRALLERRGRFVGRAHALAALEQALDRALGEKRRVSVLIRGGAGVGKSRLIAEFVAHAQSTMVPAPTLIPVAATPAGQAAPFALITDLVQASLSLPAAHGRTARIRLIQRLRHVFGRTDYDAATIDQLAAVLEQAAELRDGARAAMSYAAADLRERMTAFIEIFRTLHAKGPLITVMEDLHLADGASAEIMRKSLATRAPGAELLILSARPDAIAVPRTDEVVELTDLAGAELRDLVIDRLGEAASSHAVALVMARAGGNPLFIEELATAVGAAGAATEDIPATARDLILARVDRLSPPAKHALQYAAVAGPSVRARILEELVGPGIEQAVVELYDEGLLVAEAVDEGAAGELSFARGLVREVVYESLSARARRDAHGRIGRLLASRYQAGREEPPAAIAAHLELGGATAAAAAYWLHAGRLALTASDAPAAIAAFSRILALEPDAGGAIGARRREALSGREQAHRQIGDLAAQQADLRTLRELDERGRSEV